MTIEPPGLQARVLTSWDEVPCDDWLAVTVPQRDHVFLTPTFQRAWWESVGPGDLRVVVVSCGHRPVALAPLFVAGGMAFFVGSGGSDYLDFVGAHDRPGVLELILRTARAEIPGFVGFRFHHVPDSSPTGHLLARAAPALGLTCFDEGSLVAPRLSLTPETLHEATTKKSLLRHERWLASNGHLVIAHHTDNATIQGLLPEFFAQHQRRWRDTDSPSLLSDPQQQMLYRHLAFAGTAAGWLRFTEVRWNDDPAAFHFGFSHAGTFLWYKPSFAIDLAARSPGEVLLRQLLLAAGGEQARTFDFGLGDEPFKSRFASSVETVRTWGLYPEHDR